MIHRRRVRHQPASIPGVRVELLDRWAEAFDTHPNSDAELAGVVLGLAARGGL